MENNINQAAIDPTVDAFQSLLANDGIQAPQQFRTRLADAKMQLERRFRDGEAVEVLVAAHAGLVDALLVELWQNLNIKESQFSLVAVGGYGRGELHPGSDIDILLLHDGEDADPELLGPFVTSLWDVGLEVGHSVRTVAQCQESASDDVTVATTLMEARRLHGSNALFEQMQQAISKTSIWPAREFFLAKQQEQRARHHRYDDTGYNLEPNIKGSPGGLRDIQMISWVAARHFGTQDLSSLINVGFLTEGQYDRLIEGQHYLWTVRYGLHVLTGRREDRLLFDHQKSLAELLGYEDARYTLGVEQMMQRYYRTVMQLSRLNEMLLQLFEEDILLAHDEQPAKLNDLFISRNGYLQIENEEDGFQRNPSALLEVFRCLQDNPQLKGVSARTIALIRENRGLIDEQFRQHPRHHRTFLSLLKAEHGVTRELRRMNRYGLLGRYIPAFGRIVGRMQYDLFHAYTVDEHTLFVVANLRRFATQMPDDEFRHYSVVMQSLDAPELSYLSGLFHDIAKGRGGDHSELGATDALAFCREHGLSEDDAQLVSWLVGNHLVLSMTAQKKDISDPDVIANFAKHVGDQRHLDFLYVLTAADVRGTNPKLWNSWKSKLFRDLYDATSEALQRGLQNPLKRDSLVEDTRQQANELLHDLHAEGDVRRITDLFPSDYYLRHSPEEISWHTAALLNYGENVSFVDVKPREDLNAVAITLYTPHVRHTFAAVTAALDTLGLSVLDARIEPMNNDYSLDTYIVVEEDGKPLLAERIEDIKMRMHFVLQQDDDYVPEVTRKPERRRRMFSTTRRIAFRLDKTMERTVVEITCADYPGLLRTIGEVLIVCDIYINTAKIVTIGERAEDVFYLSNNAEEPLTEKQQADLEAALLTALSQDTLEHALS
ncbi:MAG: [protein-PII] uridylyltransferase [Woeseiaceae bacterium]